MVVANIQIIQCRTKGVDYFLITMAQVEDTPVGVTIEESFIPIHIMNPGTIPLTHDKVHSIFFKKGGLACRDMRFKTFYDALFIHG